MIVFGRMCAPIDNMSAVAVCAIVKYIFDIENSIPSDQHYTKLLSDQQQQQSGKVRLLSSSPVYVSQSS